MKRFTVLLFVGLLMGTASTSFAVDYGDCYGKFHFTDRSSVVFCKPGITTYQCDALVEHYEKRFKEKYQSFYYASRVLDATEQRNGCAQTRSFPK